MRVQKGAYGQPLYEQGPASGLPPALLARPTSASSQPAPLITWKVQRRRPRLARQRAGDASAMEGASTLTVAMALDIERHESFIASFAGH